MVLLTPRHSDILRIAAGLGYRTGMIDHVSNRLMRSPKTVDAYLSNIRKRLKVQDIFSACLKAFTGGMLSLDEVVGKELETIHHDLSGLTNSQQRVVRTHIDHALRYGKISRTEIARQLGITIKTLETHIQRIYKRVDLHNTAQFATAAYALFQKGSPEELRKEYHEVLDIPAPLDDIVTDKQHELLQIPALPNYRLTDKQHEVLQMAASPNYRGSVKSYISSVLGKSSKTIRDHLSAIRRRMGSLDIFSACYRAFREGVITLDEVVGTDLLRLQSRIDRLSDSEKNLLSAYAEYSLRKGHLSPDEIARQSGISIKTLKTHIAAIYTKLRLTNYPQLAMAAFVYSEGYNRLPKDSAALEQQEGDQLLEELAEELTDQQKEILRIGVSLGYNGGLVSHVSNRLMRSPKTVYTHLMEIRRRFDVHDTFTACYKAFHHGIISLDEAVGEEMKSLQSRIDTLSPRQKQALKVVVDHALAYGNITTDRVAERNNINAQTLAYQRSQIYRALGVKNNAQFATAAYAFSVREGT